MPVLGPGFRLPPTPFRPVDVLGKGSGQACGAAALLPLAQWYVRAGGSNNNGGSSTSLTPERNGTDGVANNTSTFTSATAAFASADIGKGICISAGSTARRHTIVSVTNGTTVVLDRVCTLNASGQTWAIGGAWADPRPAWGDSAVTGDTNSAVVSGDSVWIGAGVYRMQSTMGANWKPTSASRVYIVGDVDGAQTGDAGMVQLTAYITSDKTATPFNPTIDLNGKGNLFFANLYVVVGNTSSNDGINASVSGSFNVTWHNCAFHMGASAARRIFSILVPYGANMNWLFDRCWFIGGGAGVTTGGHFVITSTLGPGADYDMNFTLTNCHHLIGPTPAIAVTTTGSGSGKGGGIRIYNASSLGPQLLNTSGTSTSIPCIVKNSFIYCGNNAALAASVTGQIIEDYNFNTSNVANSNVPAGPHSQNAAGSSWSPLFYFGQERIWGGTPRMFGEPIAGGPMTAFGADGSETLLDLRGGPRPAGAPRTDAGAIQLGSNFGQETVLVHTGSNAVSVVGDGYQDFDLAVDAGPVTVSVFCQFDSSYTGPLPRWQIINGGQTGLGASEVSFTRLAQGAWEQQSIAINPTSAGVITVRLISGDTSGISKVAFDTFAVA